MEINIRYPLLDKDYQVKLELFDKRSERPFTTLAYRVHVHAESMIWGNNTNLHFQRSDMNLNDEKIHEPILEMMLVSAEILQQLKLEMTQYGEISQVKNMKELQKQWKDNIRFRMEHIYAAEVAQGVLSSMDKQMNDEKLFILSLQRDPFLFFYTCLFNPQTDRLPAYWLAGFPVWFDRTDQYNSDATKAELVLTLPAEQLKLLQQYYTPIYGEGVAIVSTGIKYSLTDGCLAGMQAEFAISWNELPVKSFKMEIESLTSK